jgi:hypothetical protein
VEQQWKELEIKQEPTCVEIKREWYEQPYQTHAQTEEDVWASVLQDLKLD